MSHRKDANQREIEQALQRAGAETIDCTIAPGLGFDLLVAHRSNVYIVEVKDGSKTPSQRRLTDGEQRRKVQLENKGVKYNIVESVNDALKLIGVIQG